MKLLNGDPATPETPGVILQARLDQQRLGREKSKHDQLFTDAARSISLATGLRNYRSPNAREHFQALEAARLLDKATLDLKLGLLRQDELTPVGLVSWPSVSVGGAVLSANNALISVQDRASLLGERIPEAVVLARLAKNPDISDWVERGQQLHARHDPNTCEYCGNSISAERIRELALHFSNEDAALRADLDELTEVCRAIYVALERWELPDMARLYPDLRPAYGGAVNTLDQCRKILRDAVTALGKALVEKRSATQSVVLIPHVAACVGPLVDALEALNFVLREHNDRSAAFKSVKAAALMEVKNHYLSEIAEEAKLLAASQQKLEETIERSEREIDRLTSELDQFRSQVSSAHRACDLLNRALQSFLGRAELVFRPEPIEGPEVTAFGIYRGDHPATHLSEGEKTAIAFTYFVVHLADGNIAPEESIVVIDDPISSLDTNSLYQAFAFLKGAVRDFRQVFVLTHSFDFLKLLLNWRNREKSKTGYYMVINKIIDGKRRAELSPMDQALRDHETEYHYLFKRLKQLRAAQDGTISSAYPVPNMARKLWDSFLMFRVPSSGSPYAKTTALKDAGYDPQKLDAIYKYVNDQSHITGSGFDPSLVPETTNALNAIFEIMQASAPEHFAILDATTQ